MIEKNKIADDELMRVAGGVAEPDDDDAQSLGRCASCGTFLTLLDDEPYCTTCGVHVDPYTKMPIRPVQGKQVAKNPGAGKKKNIDNKGNIHLRAL